MSKEKVTEGIEKIISKSFYATSKELAQAICNSLAIDKEQIKRLLITVSCDGKYIGKNSESLSEEIAKRNIIKVKE